MNKRIEVELQKHISEFILLELGKTEFITVTDVKLISNGTKAVVFVSLLNTDETERILKNLNELQRKAKSFIVKKKLNMRYIPNIQFQVDPNIKQAW